MGRQRAAALPLAARVSAVPGCAPDRPGSGLQLARCSRALGRLGLRRGPVRMPDRASPAAATPQRFPVPRAPTPVRAARPRQTAGARWPAADRCRALRASPLVDLALLQAQRRQGLALAGARLVDARVQREALRQSACSRSKRASTACRSAPAAAAAPHHPPAPPAAHQRHEDPAGPAQAHGHAQVSDVSTSRRARRQELGRLHLGRRDTVRGNSCASGPSVYSAFRAAPPPRAPASRAGRTARRPAR
jgi:hypothetical protein